MLVSLRLCIALLDSPQTGSRFNQPLTLYHTLIYFAVPRSRQRPLPDVPCASHQVLQRKDVHMYKDKQLGKVRRSSRR